MLVYYPVVKGICIFTGNDIAFTVFLPFAIYCHFLIIRSHNFAFSFERVYIISFVSVAVTASCTCFACIKVVIATFPPFGFICYIYLFFAVTGVGFCDHNIKITIVIFYPAYRYSIAKFKSCF